MTDVLSILSLVVAVIAVVVSIVSAVSSSRSAKRSADAAVRSASADEEALADQREAARPRAEWSEVQPGERNHGRLINVGSGTAFGAVLSAAEGTVFPDSDQRQDVDPRDGLGFVGFKAMGARCRVRLDWTDADGTRRHTEREL